MHKISSWNTTFLSTLLIFFLILSSSQNSHRLIRDCLDGGKSKNEKKIALYQKEGNLTNLITNK